MLKLVMTWDIANGREQEYFEFVVREFIPGVQRLGIELSDAWATVYGDYPQIMVSAVFPSRSKAQLMMTSDEWKELNNQLLDYVTNFSSKLIPARGGFQF